GELRHRLPAPPLRLPLYRTRVPLPVHLLPLAPDRRGASLPDAEPGARGRGDGPGRAPVPAGEGVLLRRRHLHRRSREGGSDRGTAPHTIQVSLAAPYPGTALYEEARRNDWLEDETLVDGTGLQQSALGYPHLSRTEIFQSMDLFYRRFYFRPRKIISLSAEM